MALPNYVRYLFQISIFCLILLPQARSLSFVFNGFGSEQLGLVKLEGDASAYNNILQLTKNYTDNVGHATYYETIHLWDKSSRQLADWETTFDFVIDGPKDLHGDGLSFFLAPLKFMIPEAYAAGGYLALFHRETALDTSKNQVVAIEIDTHENEWDLSSKHLGINVNSIKSVATSSIFITCKESQFKGTARIQYSSQSKVLTAGVTVHCDDGSVIQSVPTVSYGIDLKSVLPEFVTVGFSAATGSLVETHDIVSWSFNSNL